MALCTKLSCTIAGVPVAKLDMVKGTWRGGREGAIWFAMAETACGEEVALLQLLLFKCVAVFVEGGPSSVAVSSV